MNAPADWPDGVTPLAVEDLERLGIDTGNRLFWDGKRVEIHRRLVLTRLQKVVAGVVTLCAILSGLGGFASGLNNASLFLCSRGLHWLSCPVTGR